MQQQIENIMEEIRKMNGVLRGNCCITSDTVPQKTPKKEFI